MLSLFFDSSVRATHVLHLQSAQGILYTTGFPLEICCFDELVMLRIESDPDLRLLIRLHFLLRMVGMVHVTFLCVVFVRFIVGFSGDSCETVNSIALDVHSGVQLSNIEVTEVKQKIIT